MDEEKALALTNSDDILRAALEAEQRNCRLEVIRQLYKNYYTAIKKEALMKYKGELK
jgi:hypothetical protein